MFCQSVLNCLCFLFLLLCLRLCEVSKQTFTTFQLTKIGKSINFFYTRPRKEKKITKTVVLYIPGRCVLHFHINRIRFKNPFHKSHIKTTIHRGPVNTPTHRSKMKTKKEQTFFFILLLCFSRRFSPPQNQRRWLHFQSEFWKFSLSRTLFCLHAYENENMNEECRCKVFIPLSFSLFFYSNGNLLWFLVVGEESRLFSSQILMH